MNKRDGLQLEKQIQNTVTFYLAVLGLRINPEDLENKMRVYLYRWTLFVHESLEINRLWEVCKKRFVSSHSFIGKDIKQALATNQRDPQKSGSYIFRVRRCIEADEKWGNEIGKMNDGMTITLLERILLELWCYWQFHRHLDVKSWTFCSGSTLTSGNIPGAGTYDKQFRITWHPPFDVEYHEPLCIRRVELIGFDNEEEENEIKQIEEEEEDI